MTAHLDGIIDGTIGATFGGTKPSVEPPWLCGTFGGTCWRNILAEHYPPLPANMYLPHRHMLITRAQLSLVHVVHQALFGSNLAGWQSICIGIGPYFQGTRLRYIDKFLYDRHVYYYHQCGARAAGWCFHMMKNLEFLWSEAVRQGPMDSSEEISLRWRVMDLDMIRRAYLLPLEQPSS